MKVLRYTLSFVLGIILGIVLLVLAIGGTVVAIGMSMTVGSLQSSLTDAEVISPDSSLYSSTLLEAIKSVINDYQNFNKLSLKLLYEHYGIELLNGISGLDFTQKSFYDVPITDIINDLSILTSSLSLNDIASVAGLDLFGKIPLLDDNKDVGLTTALDNILASVNGDKLTLRSIKDNFGIDLAAGSDMISALQDIALNSFGSTVDALRIGLFLTGDTNSYVRKGENKLYLAVEEDSTDAFVAIPADQVASTTVTPGAETYIAGAKTVDDSTLLDVRELRYVKKIVTVDDVEQTKFVVDNSCYASNSEPYEEGSTPANTTFYRHMLYRPYDAQKDASRNAEDLLIHVYADSLERADVTSIIDKGFVSLAEIQLSESASYATADIDRTNGVVNITGAYYADGEIAVASPEYGFVGDEIKKSSKLTELGEEAEPIGDATYFRCHLGTSAAILQTINYMSIADLRNADGLLDNIKISDVIEITEESPKILQAIGDCTLTTIGDRIPQLEIGDLFDVEAGETSLIMKSLAKRHCTIDDLASVADTLTLGEIIEVTYDKYVAATDGKYIREPLYVKYNEYAPSHNPEVGDPDYDYVKRFRKDGDAYVEDDAGEFVRVYYYTLYDETNEAQQSEQKYSLDTPSETAVAMQSIARRGCTIPELGTVMNDLFISELMRIDNDSAQIMKSLAKRNVTLEQFDEVIDDLEIADVIEINQESSKLMRTLKERGTKISELGTVTDELAIGDMIEIVYDNYVESENGKYVKVEDGDKYYYTLFNPAVHTGGEQRYDLGERNSAASSKILQRFASTTLGGFSDGFSGLQVADVMDIDADIYALAGGDGWKQDEDSNWYFEDAVGNKQRLYYYVEEDGLFRLADQEYIKQAKAADKPLYYVATPGEGNAVLRKLAYVNIDEMGPALGKILDDMLLGEIIDVYTAYAIDVEQNAGAPTKDESGRYFVEWQEGGEVDAEGRKILYLYDGLGKYTQAKTRYDLLADEASELNNKTEFFYQYKSIKEKAQAAACVKAQNIYFYDQENDEMVFNLPLCTYLATQVTDSNCNLYYRVEGGSSETHDGNAISDTFKGYKYNGSDLYVDIMGKKVAYSQANPAFCDLPKYIKNSSDRPTLMQSVDALETDAETDGKKYSKHFAEEVYVVDNSGTFVYVSGEYVTYDANNDAHKELQRFTKKWGYIAEYDEVFAGGEDAAIEHCYHIKSDGGMIREKSAAILRLLANGTMKDLNGAISTATMEQIVDIAPDSMFDNENIRTATLSNMGTHLQQMLSDMTVDDLLVWANVDGVTAEIRAILKGVTIPNFFTSLQFNATSGMLYLDLMSLYGYKSE